MMMLARSAGIAAAMLTALLFIHPGSAPAAASTPSLETVGSVDLDRYAGTWHEIARLPNPFQDQCVADVTASYRLRDDGMLDVINRCRTANGDYDEANGVARVSDPVSQARLEVSFVSLFGWQLFWGDYWILDLDPDYTYAVVGMPSRRYAWVLAREAQLAPATWRHIQRVLRKAGYDPAAMLGPNEAD